MSLAKVTFLSQFLSLKNINQEQFMKQLKQIVRVFIGIFILLKTFHYATSIEEICFYFSLLIALIVSIFKKTDSFFESPLTFPFIFFVSWAIIDLFFALNKENSLRDIYGHLLKYLAFYYLLINFFNSRKHLVYLSWIVVISTSAYAIFFLIYFYIVLGNNLSTLFRIHVYLDYLYVFAFLLSIQLFSGETKILNKILLLICLPTTTIATILTQTRTALPAISIALIILLWKKKILLGFLMILFLLPFVLAPYFASRLNLRAIWEHKNIRIGVSYLFMEMVKDHPITGIGFGMQTYDDPKLLAIYNKKVPSAFRQEPPIASPHNLFMDIAVRLGLVGLGLWIYILITFGRMVWRLIRRGKDDFIRKWSLCLFAGITAFFIQSIAFDATFGIQAIVFYTLLAMITILWRLDKRPEISTHTEAKRAS